MTHLELLSNVIASLLLLMKLQPVLQLVVTAIASSADPHTQAFLSSVTVVLPCVYAVGGFWFEFILVLIFIWIL